MLFEILLGVVTITIFMFYVWITKENLKNLPPGPKGVFWFGLKIDIPNMHLDFTKWWKAFGDVFEVKILGRRILVLNSPKTIREAFESKAYTTLMNHRPPNFIGYKICNQYKCVLLRKYDPTFIAMKKEMVNSMDTHGFQSKHFRSLAADMMNDVVKDFIDLNGRPIDPMNVLRPSFCKMIGTLFAGNCSHILQKHVADFDSHGDQMIKPQIHGVYKKFPWIRWIPFQFYNRLYKLVQKIKKDLQKALLFDLRNSYNTSNIKCMVHQLFRSQDLQRLERGKPWLTDAHIHGIAMDLINTSILTTKAVMSGFIFLLLHFPEMQQKIQEEIDDVIGKDRQPEVDDRKKTPYIQACIYECLRYQSHLPLTAPHYNRKKVDIFKFTIPPKTIIFGNLFACHHDEELWEDPWTFKPERYLTEGGQLIDKDHPNMINLIAFGVGERMCVGYEMALDRMFLYTTYILQKFSFVVPNGSQLKSHDPRNLVSESPVLLPPPYMCRVVKRKEMGKDEAE